MRCAAFIEYLSLQYKLKVEGPIKFELFVVRVEACAPTGSVIQLGLRRWGGIMLP